MRNKKIINVKVVSDRKNIFEKLKSDGKIGVITKWILGGSLTITILSALIYYFNKGSNSDTTSTSNKNNASVHKENKKTNPNISNKAF